MARIEFDYCCTFAVDKAMDFAGNFVMDQYKRVVASSDQCSYIEPEPVDNCFAEINRKREKIHY